MHKNDSLFDGIGTPDWRLTLCLLFSWLCVAIILIKGIKSSGKASYFLAIFPYVIILILLVHACTLKGAFNGILYFLTPQWDQLLNVTVSCTHSAAGGANAPECRRNLVTRVFVFRCGTKP